jgi:hypothetical protein
MLEAGHINAKNVKGVLLKNFSDNAIGVVVWVLFGWGLYEGDSVFAAGNTNIYLSIVAKSNTMMKLRERLHVPHVAQGGGLCPHVPAVWVRVHGHDVGLRRNHRPVQVRRVPVHVLFSHG